jgi:hypothetical protein
LNRKLRGIRLESGLLLDILRVTQKERKTGRKMDGQVNKWRMNEWKKERRKERKKERIKERKKDRKKERKKERMQLLRSKTF